MTKITWKKVHNQKLITKAREESRDFVKRDFKLFLDHNLWTLHGKYYGKPVGTLPLNYLEWIIDNKQGLPYQVAVKELYKRYNELTTSNT